MSPKKDKKTFQWQTGQKLANEEYEPLGDIRSKGFSKLADAIYADPEKRKEQRQTRLKKGFSKSKSGEILVEESTSGVHLSPELTKEKDKNISRLISNKSSGMKDFTRFKNKSKDDTKK